MKKILKFIAMAIIITFLVGCFTNAMPKEVSAQPLDGNSTNPNRAAETGILISAWSMDTAGITPAQCYQMILNEYSAYQVSFAAVKITYGYDPGINTAAYTAQRIGVWVAYFAQYFSVIYVASRSVFHTGYMLSQLQINTYYSDLATVLNAYPQVKCFLGEEEPEALQVNPITNAPIGNNLAYSSVTVMMNYITDLHNTWHLYSNIPFTFESIPPESDSNGVISNVDNWFFGSVSDTTYWAWIDANQDIFAIDEWRDFSGVQMWAQHVDYYDLQLYVENYPNTPTYKYIFIGETFNLDWTQVASMLDEFNQGWLNELNYFFWWELSGSEPDLATPGYTEPYVYFNDGYAGHDWAFLNMQTVSPNNIPGNGLVSCQTYTDSGSDLARATTSVQCPLDPSDTTYWATFNIDMMAASGTGSGNDAVLGYWGFTVPVYVWYYGQQYLVGYDYAYDSIEAYYNGGNQMYLIFTYFSVYGGEATYVMPTPLVANCWSYASLTMTGYYMEFQYTWENPVTGVETLWAYNAGWGAYPAPQTVYQVGFGAFGGQLCKLYEGGIGMTCPYTPSDNWADKFGFGGTLSGWTLSYTQPSMVQQSGLIVPGNGPMWMLKQLATT